MKCLAKFPEVSLAKFCKKKYLENVLNSRKPPLGKSLKKSKEGFLKAYCDELLGKLLEKSLKDLLKEPLSEVPKKFMKEFLKQSKQEIPEKKMFK